MGEWQPGGSVNTFFRKKVLYSSVSSSCSILHFKSVYYHLIFMWGLVCILVCIYTVHCLFLQQAKLYFPFDLLSQPAECFKVILKLIRLLHLGFGRHLIMVLDLLLVFVTLIFACPFCTSALLISVSGMPDKNGTKPNARPDSGSNRQRVLLRAVRS